MKHSLSEWGEAEVLNPRPAFHITPWSRLVQCYLLNDELTVGWALWIPVRIFYSTRIANTWNSVKIIFLFKQNQQKIYVNI